MLAHRAATKCLTCGNRIHPQCIRVLGVRRSALAAKLAPPDSDDRKVVGSDNPVMLSPRLSSATKANSAEKSPGVFRGNRSVWRYGRTAWVRLMYQTRAGWISRIPLHW